jgi:hypothetical protein
MHTNNFIGMEVRLHALWKFILDGDEYSHSLKYSPTSPKIVGSIPDSIIQGTSNDLIPPAALLQWV